MDSQTPSLEKKNQLQESRAPWLRTNPLQGRRNLRGPGTEGPCPEFRVERTQHDVQASILRDVLTVDAGLRFQMFQERLPNTGCLNTIPPPVSWQLCPKRPFSRSCFPQTCQGRSDYLLWSRHPGLCIAGLMGGNF